MFLRSSSVIRLSAARQPKQGVYLMSQQRENYVLVFESFLSF